MVIPVFDHNPFKLPVPPLVTWGIIAVNFVAFLIQQGAGDANNEIIIKTFGAIPSQIDYLAPRIGYFPADLTLVTSLFLHEGWEHIIGNMLYLFVFGDDIEEALGPVRFLVFYLLSGIAASAAFVVVNAHSDLPLIGASGAISGVLGAYLLIRPCAKVSVIFSVILIRVPAWLVIGLFVLLQAYHISNWDDDGVAYMAHLGGVVAGVMLLLALRPRGLKLLECIWDPEAAAPQPPAQ
jgi:membrane associated rhomboid family serine protease